MAAPTVVGTPAHGKTTGSQSSFTVSLTVPSGASHLLALGGIWSGNFQSVTYGGVNLTKLFDPRSTANRRGEAWVLASPSAGTANLVFTGAASNFYAGGGVCLADCTGLFCGTSQQGASSPTNYLWSPVDALIIDLVTSDWSGVTFTPDASQTSLWNDNGIANTDEKSWASYKTAAPGDTTAMTWNTGSNAVAQIIVAAAGTIGGAGGAVPRLVNGGFIQ